MIVLLSVLATASCGGDRVVSPHDDPSDSTPMTKLLHLDFDGARVTGDRMSVPNSGKLPVQVRIVTGGGGNAVIATGPAGRDALRLPRIDESPNPQGAVLLVTPKDAGGDQSQLSPKSRDFTFGGTFALDQRSEQEGGSDNGNNFVQRGLSADPTQYKLQVDHGHVSCRVKGDLGELEVISRAAVKPETWYTATCSRQARTLTLTLQTGGSTERVSRTGDTGSVTAPSSTPLTIGGKSFDGHVVTGNSDQFNGQIGEVFLDVRSPAQ